jgi:hypothetical protein
VCLSIVLRKLCILTSIAGFSAFFTMSERETLICFENSDAYLPAMWGKRCVNVVWVASPPGRMSAWVPGLALRIARSLWRTAPSAQEKPFKIVFAIHCSRHSQEAACHIPNTLSPNPEVMR